MCTITKLIIVERASINDFTHRSVGRAATLATGDPRDETIFLGRMSRRRGRDADR